MKPNETNRAECITDEQRWTQCPCYGPSHGMDHLTKTLLRLPEICEAADLRSTKTAWHRRGSCFEQPRIDVRAQKQPGT